MIYILFIIMKKTKLSPTDKLKIIRKNIDKIDFKDEDFESKIKKEEIDLVAVAGFDNGLFQTIENIKR